jgi:transposase
LARLPPQFHGEPKQILRREGIYSSTLTSWRKERDDAVDGAFSKKRGPEPKHNPFSAENEKLRRQNQRLQEELRKAEIIIDVQKKVAMLLGRPLPPVPDSEKF